VVRREVKVAADAGLNMRRKVGVFIGGIFFTADGDL
jgi:hypothetical protein